MTQVSKYPISDNIYRKILEIFFKTFVEIKTKNEAKQLIDDFLSPTEQIMLAKRLAIVFLLEKGYDFRSISKIIRVSISTVARINFQRKYGSSGYKKIIGKLLLDEQIKDFLLSAGESLAEVLGHSSKGGSSWRYLKKEISRKRKENKPF